MRVSTRSQSVFCKNIDKTVCKETVPGKKNCHGIGTTSQCCLVSVDMANCAQHADCVVRAGIGSEGMQVGGQNPRR